MAAMALASLAMVLLALVVMYLRDPAFLTLTGKQALDYRVIQEVLAKVRPGMMEPGLMRSLMGDLMGQIDSRGHSSRVADLEQTTDLEAEELQREADEIEKESESLSGDDSEPEK